MEEIKLFLAMKLVAEMKEKFRVKMDIRELFSHIEFNALLDWINNAISITNTSQLLVNSTGVDLIDESNKMGELAL